MKQLSINVAKNVAINELACNPNMVVLAKKTTSTNAKTGEVTTTIRYIEVCRIEKTDSLHIVQNLLKYIVAEFFVCKDLETDFAETNIKQRKLFNQFLTGDTIYRTDASGKIASALVSEVPLNRTALRVQKTHSVVICKPENRKAAIYQHAKAVRAQCVYISLIKDKAATIDKDAETAAAAAAVPETATETATETTTAPTPARGRARTSRRRTAPTATEPATVAAA